VPLPQNSIEDKLSAMASTWVPVPAGVLEACVPHPTVWPATPDAGGMLMFLIQLHKRIELSM
jgi:hypothetical protein